jgi:hypothetical protein
VVDETGNQTVVFGRRGSRPFNEKEFNAFIRKGTELYRVEDVKMQDGKLVTTSGKPLTPTDPFPQEPAKPIQRPQRDRLERRPVAGQQ